MTKPWIVCAAIRHEDIIICGARHYDSVMRGVIDAFPEPLRKNLYRGATTEQGFIDQFGKFYTREEALETASKNATQWLVIDMERNSCQNRLYSEGLY